MYSQFSYSQVSRSKGTNYYLSGKNSAVYIVVVFPTNRNSHFPETNLLAGSQSRFPRTRGICYPSGRKYHYIANFPIVRFPRGRGETAIHGGKSAMWCFSYNLK